MADVELLDVAHVSKKASSIRISIPKKVIEQLGIEPEDILGFYLVNGKVFMEKLR